MLQAVKVNWIRKILDDTEDKWKIILNWIFKGIGVKYFLTCRFKEYDLPNFFTIVLYSGFLTFKEIYKRVPESGTEVLFESIWCNSEIKCSNVTLFYGDWYNAGIKYVGDIVDENGIFFSLMELQERYGIEIKNFLDYMSLLHAIPKHGKIC